MSKLFIIGNGFDRAHGLNTSYEDFHQYLKENYPDASFDGYNTPESSRVMPDGGIEYEDVDAVGFIMEVISRAEPDGENWSNLETSLGHLDLHEYMDNWLDDGDEDDNPYHEVYRNQDLAANLVGAILEITEYFADWIDTIEIIDTQPIARFEKLIDRDKDWFLTFNYTETLEILYGAKNVCHIHGKQGGELLFGHGDDTDYTEDFMNRHIGSEDSLQAMQEKLRKNTKGAIATSQAFFQDISNVVNEIYSFGFSFSKVDEVYVQEICRRMSTAHVTWFLHERNNNDDESSKYQAIIRSCGFKGKFETFSVS